MERYIKCTCGEILDVLSVLKDEHGRRNAPVKDKRYRLKCESCDWGTYLSYSVVLAIYSNASVNGDTHKLTNYKALVDIIDEATENLKDVSIERADYVERTLKFLSSVKENVEGHQSYTQKQWDAVMKCHNRILKYLEE